MPWTLEDYPVSMRHLAEVTRAKAIDIANALLAEGMEEGRAIRIATARAEEWAARRFAGAGRRVRQKALRAIKRDTALADGLGIAEGRACRA